LKQVVSIPGSLRFFGVRCWSVWIGFAVLGGCAWKGEGLIEGRPLGPVLMTSTGQELRLVLGEQDRSLAELDGHLVMIEGRRALGALQVREWTLPEGVHGMAAWVGRLERRGAQLGLLDRNSGAYYVLDPDAWDALEGAVGAEVLVEGYVDGPHRVKVLWYRVLTGTVR
jgi:hypothetical protein